MRKGGGPLSLFRPHRVRLALLPANGNFNSVTGAMCGIDIADFYQYKSHEPADVQRPFRTCSRSDYKFRGPRRALVHISTEGSGGWECRRASASSILKEGKSANLQPETAYILTIFNGEKK